MRRAAPSDKRAVAFSVVLHSTVFAVAWLSTLQRGPEIEFIAYEIELISPPPAVQAEESRPETEELIVERPEPEPPQPEEIVPIEEIEAEPEPEPEPEPAPPEPEPEPLTEPDVVDAPATSAEPVPEAETSGEDLNVRLEGLRRDYPVYYENIIKQIQRCFATRWRQGGSWETMVVFTIGRDGIASDVEFGSQSGNVAFDYTAMEAVGDCAGQGSFGPLPEDLPWPELRISFTFEPLE
jgi:outer membrane biosynthesis protein TonB